jgi:hypothetical protein
LLTILPLRSVLIFYVSIFTETGVSPLEHVTYNASNAVTHLSAFILLAVWTLSWFNSLVGPQAPCSAAR